VNLSALILFSPYGCRDLTCFLPILSVAVIAGRISVRRGKYSPLNRRDVAFPLRSIPPPSVSIFPSPSFDLCKLIPVLVAASQICAPCLPPFDLCVCSLPGCCKVSGTPSSATVILCASYLSELCACGRDV
jgi:hypothetical protein